MLDADTYLGALRAAYRAGDAWQLGALLDPLDAPTRDSLGQNLQVIALCRRSQPLAML